MPGVGVVTFAKILVLVPQPASLDQPGLERAVDIARRCNGALHLLALVYNSYVAGRMTHVQSDRQKLIAMLLDRKANDLRRHAETISARGVDCSWSAHWDHPAEQAAARQVMAGGCLAAAREGFRPFIRIAGHTAIVEQGVEGIVTEVEHGRCIARYAFMDRVPGVVGNTGHAQALAALANGQ